MQQPRQVVFVESQDERARLTQQYRRLGARGRFAAAGWSATALAPYLGMLGLLHLPIGASLSVWIGGELLLMVAAGFAIAKVADSKCQTRWWSLLALSPVLTLVFYATYFVNGLLLLYLCLMPIALKTPHVRLRSESDTWGS